MSSVTNVYLCQGNTDVPLDTLALMTVAVPCGQPLCLFPRHAQHFQRSPGLLSTVEESILPCPQPLATASLLCGPMDFIVVGVDIRWIVQCFVILCLHFCLARV